MSNLTHGEQFLKRTKKEDYTFELRLGLFVLAFCAISTLFTYWPKAHKAHADTLPITYQQRAKEMHLTTEQEQAQVSAFCTAATLDHKAIHEPITGALKDLCV